MFINPKIAIQNGWITGIKDEAKQVQPNALDFDLTSLFEVSDVSESFYLNGDAKQHQSFSPVTPNTMTSPLGVAPFFKLEPHRYYDFSSSMHVTLPAGVCALLIVRSTLNRNGIFLTSGLYDQGFSGVVAGTLHNRSGKPAYISEGSRIGQLMFIHAEDSGMLYAGGYNTKPDQHWTDATKNQVEAASAITDNHRPAGRQSFI